ncbi:hypothetical protein [Colwellia psychrerythraea]|uniref:Uncharacterized protein n=1 Tax=Colwellia psychrerythraea TaxID=28229 RepID=A0A099L2A4_COLPS|nr:hypothetical protein [Colwellia psychrerythraea]KGJ96003.1 hypothetical protein GAB14E_1754 [Colwellia psychrerythraea]
MKRSLIVAIIIATTGIAAVYYQDESPILIEGVKSLPTDKTVTDQTNRQQNVTPVGLSAEKTERPQQEKTLKRQPKKRQKSLVDNVNLSAEQTKQYQALQIDYNQQRRVLVESKKTLSPENYRQQWQQVKMKYKENLISLMSEEQFIKFNKNIEASKHVRQRHKNENTNHSHERKAPESSQRRQLSEVREN